MFDGFVESDSGEKLRIIGENQTFGGKAALAFLTMLSNYCLFSDELENDLPEVVEWFSELEKETGLAVRTELEALEKSWYSGDWGSYSSDELEFFVKRNGFEVSQFDYEVSLNSVVQRWTPIKEVKKSVITLVKMCKEKKPKRTEWYNFNDTIIDFEGILTAIEILEKRCTAKVRIQFV